MFRQQEKSRLIPIATSRRGFVSGVLGLGAAGAGLATFGRSAIPEAASETAPTPAGGKVGYHETEHIRSYYRSAW